MYFHVTADKQWVKTQISIFGPQAVGFDPAVTKADALRMLDEMKESFIPVSKSACTNRGPDGRCLGHLRVA